MITDINFILLYELMWTVKACELAKTSKEIHEIRKTVLGKNSPIKLILRELGKR